MNVKTSLKAGSTVSGTATTSETSTTPPPVGGWGSDNLPPG